MGSGPAKMTLFIQDGPICVHMNPTLLEDIIGADEQTDRHSTTSRRRQTCKSS